MLRKNDTSDNKARKKVQAIKSIISHEEYELPDIVTYTIDDLDIFLYAWKAFKKLEVGLRYMLISPYKEETDDYESEQNEYGIIDDPLIIGKIKSKVEDSSILVKEALKEILKLPKHFCKYYSLFFIEKIRNYTNKGMLNTYLNELVENGYLQEGDQLDFVEFVRLDLQLAYERKTAQDDAAANEMYQWYEEQKKFINDIENGTLNTKEEKRKIISEQGDRLKVVEPDDDDYYTYDELVEIMNSRYNKSIKRDDAPNNIIKFPTGGKKR